MTANDLIYKSIHIITEYYENRLQPFFDAIDDDLTLLMLFQAVDAADHRRLAGAGRAADDDLLPLLHPQADIFEHMKLAVPFVDVIELDHNFIFTNIHPHALNAYGQCAGSSPDTWSNETSQNRKPRKPTQ